MESLNSLTEYIVYFTFGIHLITFGGILQFSRDHDLGQITSGFAHLTHSLGHELNGQSHWLFDPGHGS